MSERNLRRRTSVHERKSRPPQPTTPHRRQTPPPLRRPRPTKPMKIFRRCSSEPLLSTIKSLELDGQRQPRALLCRPHTCTDVFASTLRSLSPSPYSSQRYKDDTKVVLNVTVEGSPGPVRTMVNLGASVEDTIKLIVDKYSQEGRSPKLDHDSVSAFELHHSYFSLEGLNKSDRIGDVGSRSFYLRKSTSRNNSERDMQDQDEDIVNPNVMLPSQVLYSFIARRIRKIGRRTKKIWKVLGCMACS